MLKKNLVASAVIAAAALAMTLGATVARADYNGGGPIKKGDMCWSATDGRGHGLWRACPQAPKIVHHVRKSTTTKLSHN